MKNGGHKIVYWWQTRLPDALAGRQGDRDTGWRHVRGQQMQKQ